jgi:hypothetical protein
VGWFFVGFLVPLIGIILILVQSNLKEERARYQRALSERRRLREELKMERIRSEQFRGEARARLDIHDRALGVETAKAGSGGALPPGAEPARIGGGEAAPPPTPSKKPCWYFAVDEQTQKGPMTFAELAAAYRHGRFGDADLVWRDGWDEWRVVRDDPALFRRLEG